MNEAAQEKLHAAVMSHPNMVAMDQWFADNYETATFSEIREQDLVYTETYQRIAAVEALNV